MFAGPRGTKCDTNERKIGAIRIAAQRQRICEDEFLFFFWGGGGGGMTTANEDCDLNRGDNSR